MERFSNGAILKWSNSQMEQFSNGAIWGRHPMPYFKIPRTEKYGMRCAIRKQQKQNCSSTVSKGVLIICAYDIEVIEAIRVFGEPQRLLMRNV